MMPEKVIVYFFLILSIGLLANCQETRVEQQAEDAESMPQKPAEVRADDKYIMQGKIIAQTAANALSSELTKALSSGNVESAIKYCNLHATSITDSLSFLYNARIKRTSLKVRNPENEPTPDEYVALTAFEDGFRKGQPLGASLSVDEKGNTHFYAPIFVQSFCLNCHGQPGKELTSNNHNALRQLYPNDLAVGYQAGDLRGMWSITFEQ